MKELILPPNNDTTTESVETTQSILFIGANGSGKSNLVKALEFISDISKHGLTFAINRQGGAEGLIPKDIPASRIHKTTLSIDYRKKLPPPDAKYPAKMGRRISVAHRMGIRFQKNEGHRVTSEELVFSDPLFIGKYIRDPDNAREELAASGKKYLGKSIVRYRESSFNTRKIKRELSMRPPLADMNYMDYASWFGVPFLYPQDENIDQAAFEETLYSFLDRPGAFQQEGGKTYSLLDPDVVTPFDYSQQFLWY
jgi:energy-coupling factor transporter ATP-binding protein EcfA2